MRIALFGASSLIGPHLIAALGSQNLHVVALSRQPCVPSSAGAMWSTPADVVGMDIQNWISLVPIWVLPEYFELMRSCGVRKVVALSSTSRFSKMNSVSRVERELAMRLTHAEGALQAWAESLGVHWVILRTTMLYGEGRDRNVSDIARFVRRWRMFPLVGKGKGLRQPAHAADVAACCVQAILKETANRQAFNVGGGEILSYREMVLRIARVSGVSIRFVAVPRVPTGLALELLRFFRRFRHLPSGMFDRMSQDQVFEDATSQNVLGVRMRGFDPEPVDVGMSSMVTQVSRSGVFDKICRALVRR
jgi:nucleoside-diphosphate-sugar epimerase